MPVMNGIQVKFFSNFLGIEEAREADEEEQDQAFEDLRLDCLH